jgi:hypothetical protein
MKLLAPLVFALLLGAAPEDSISDHGDGLSRSTSAQSLVKPMPAGPPGDVGGKPVQPAVKQPEPIPPPPPPKPAPTPVALAVESPGQARPVEAPAPPQQPVLAPTIPERGMRSLWLPGLLFGAAAAVVLHRLWSAQR